MDNLIDCFENTVERSKQKLAVTYKEEELSFEELMHLAKRYSATIKCNMINCPIGVFTHRDVMPIVWFIGVLYSHNYYVPIDPEMPLEKIKAVIQDAGILRIICENEDKKILDAIGYDGAVFTTADLGYDEYEDKTASVNEPAYMVYTSGSTGKPKGVLKSHGAVLSFIEAYVDTFDFHADMVIGNQTPLYFDAAAKDLYLSVKTGATIAIIPTELFSGTTDLVEYMNKKRISFCSWVPTALSLVAQMCPFSMIKPESLKQMFFVGEVMPMKHLNKWREYLPDVNYVNLYGQSELAGICCYYEIKKQYPNDAILPIGKPLKNCKIYLVDGDNLVENCNHVGEIYIVSDALALEYFNDIEKTNSSFLLKDFGNGLERCFKTGDLAQYNEDGELVFAARTDYQIKHMGRRIELGEIETIAGSLPAIARCCCLYNTERKKIILFCQLEQGMCMTGVQIRSLLKDILTSYMIPNKVIILDKLPINANGKIDRHGLKALI